MSRGKTQSTKKCCYMNRGCTPECTAYSDASELIESTKIMGMEDMHCMRLLLELTGLMSQLDPLMLEKYKSENFTNDI